jgi:hypothetical protein
VFGTVDRPASCRGTFEVLKLREVTLSSLPQALFVFDVM